MPVKRAITLFSPRRPSRTAAEKAEHQREVCAQLVARLSESTKAVQHEFHDREEPIPSCELSNELCRTLEALFIHGLRDTFMERVSSALSDDSKPPQPNFWLPLCVISHSDVLKQLGDFSQIRTDIGKARSWIRLALNDGLLTSYLAMMVEDRRLLSFHWEKLALIRDREQMDVVQKYLQGLESLRFATATNSSLLNSMDEVSLEMAGIWFLPRQVGGGSVSPGQDVAATIAEPTPRPKPPSEMELPRPPSGPDADSTTLILNALDPDMAFNHIMNTTAVDQVLAPPKPTTTTAGGGAGSGMDSEASSLAGELAAITKTPPPPPESYISVLESYRENSPRARSLMQTPDVQFVFGRSVDSSAASATSATSSGGGSTELETSGETDRQPPVEDKVRQNVETEQVPDPVGAPETATSETKTKNPPQDTPDDTPPKPKDTRYRWLSEISSEFGLDKQRYTCGGCQRFVGMLYGEPRLCTLDGMFYCGDCHTGRDHAQMPSRVIHNWDFDRYPVARCSREFLEQVDAEPTINVADQNISIYNISAEMDRVRLLRVRLVFLNAFLHTCRSGAAAELDRRLAGRRHLCEHVHLYAPVDLRDTRNGSLTTTLQSVVEFAVEHVLACGLCSQKGFVCEFCRDPKIIYPFELETTRQCRQCYGLYHSRCWRRPAGCPRCERYRRRAELHRLLEEPDLGRSSPRAGTQSPDKQSQSPAKEAASASAVSA